MSDQEKAQIIGAALIEFENAKSSLALLRVKAQLWVRLQEKVSRFLSRSIRDGSCSSGVIQEGRAEIVMNLSDFTAASDLEAVMRLDLQLAAAVERFRAAKSVKKSLGFE